MRNTENTIHRIILRSLMAIAFMLVTLTAAAQEEPHMATYYIQRAESFIQSNAWTAAKREIDHGLEIYPENADLRYLNGRYYYVTGHLQEARYNLIRCIQSDDQHYRAKRAMVDVEDDSKHYSSAICYINELLEFQPYDRDLWRRKISLYRKIHNTLEADAALERLARIYPNDSVVRNDLVKLHRNSIGKLMKKSKLEESAQELEKWIDIDPNNLEYYIELMKLYQRMGDNERAVGVGNRGLIYFPNNATLTNKIIGILSEMGNYSQALKIARKNASSSVYTDLLQEAAADARLHDPYEMYGKLYAETHDNEALQYLLNTSLTRGYYDDARAYLSDAMRRQGRTTPLLMKLYELEKRTGNENAMRKVLQELYLSSPNDEELKGTYAEMMLHLGVTDIEQQQWADADQHLQRALDLMPVNHESWPAAVSMRIISLAQQGKYDEAKELFLKASDMDYSNRKRYAYAYEQPVANHLRVLIEEENYSDALKEAEDLLRAIPESETALRCCINMSQTLKLDELFHKYAEMGYEKYPDSPYFVVKRAISLQQQGRSAEALEMVNPSKRKAGEYESPLFISAHSGIASEWAGELLKMRMPETAMMVIDTALVYDGKNKELLYLKGLAYELMKDFANAYDYQKKYYEPSNAEQAEYYQHMRYLGFKALKNHIDASYVHAVYNNKVDEISTTAHLYSIATIAYSRVEKKNTYLGQVRYKGVDGYNNEYDTDKGGVGLEFMGQWEHTFNHRWSGMANAAVSTKYFNKFGANASASYTMDHGWVPSLKLGYRRTPKTYLYLRNDEGETETILGEFSLFLLTPSVEKTWTERIKTSLNVDVITLRNSLYFNVGLKGKLFINDDNISSVSLLAGVGTFPELSFFEQTALKNVSHTNAMVGFDAQYLVTRHLYLGLTGNWNTYFSPYVDKDGILNDSYRNVYSLTLQMHLAF